MKKIFIHSRLENIILFAIILVLCSGIIIPPSEALWFFNKKESVDVSVLFQDAKNDYGNGLYKEAIEKLEQCLESDFEREGEARLLLAKANLAIGENKEVLKCFKDEVLNEYPQDLEAEVHAVLGRAHYARGELEEAESEFAKALQLDESNAESHFYMGLLCEEKEDYEQALEFYLKARQQNASLEHLSARLGTVYFYMERYEQAAEELREAMKSETENEEVMTMLMISLLDTGHTQEAVNLYQEINGTQDSTTEKSSLTSKVIDHIIKRNPLSKAYEMLKDIVSSSEKQDLEVDLFNKSMEEGNLENAGSFLREIDVKEVEEPVFKENLKTYHFLSASADYGNGLYKEAIEKLEQCLESDFEREGEARLLLAKANLAIGENKEVLKCFKDEVLNEYPQDLEAEVHAVLGRAHYARGELEEAESEFAKALQLDESNAESNFYMGLLSNKTSRYSAAKEFFLKARKEHYLDDAVLTYNLGIAYFNLNEYKLASVELLKATELTPSDPEILKTYIVSLSKSGEPDKAIGCYSTLRDKLDLLERHDMAVEIFYNAMLVQDLVIAEKVIGDIDLDALNNQPDFHVKVIEYYLLSGNKGMALQKLELLRKEHPDIAGLQEKKLFADHTASSNNKSEGIMGLIGVGTILIGMYLLHHMNKAGRIKPYCYLLIMFLLLLSLLVLGFAGYIAEALRFGGLDYISKTGLSHVDSISGKALDSFVDASITKGILDIIEGSGVSVVANIELGDLAQPIIDIVNVLWKTLLICTSVLLGMKFLFTILIYVGNISIIPVIIISIIILGITGILKNNGKVVQLLRKIRGLLLCIFVIFVMVFPLSIYGSSLISDKLVQTRLETAVKDFSGYQKNLQNTAYILDTSELAEEGNNGKSKFVDIRPQKSFEKLWHYFSRENFEQILQLCVLFIFDVFVFPIGLLILLLFLVKYVYTLYSYEEGDYWLALKDCWEESPPELKEKFKKYYSKERRFSTKEGIAKIRKIFKSRNISTNEATKEGSSDPS